MNTKQFSQKNNDVIKESIDIHIRLLLTFSFSINYSFIEFLCLKKDLQVIWIIF